MSCSQSCQTAFEITKGLLGDFVPEENDDSIRAILWRTILQILQEEDSKKMKFTEEELEKEVEDYRPYAISTAKENHPKEVGETEEEWETRLNIFVETMCELHRDKIAQAYGVAQKTMRQNHE
jgi:hypothetical protein